MVSMPSTNVEVKFLQYGTVIKSLIDWSEDTSEIYQGQTRVDDMSYEAGSFFEIVGYVTHKMTVLDLDEELREKGEKAFGVAVKYKTFNIKDGQVDSIGVTTFQDFDDLLGSFKHPYSKRTEGKYSIFLKSGKSGIKGVVGESRKL